MIRQIPKLISAERPDHVGVPDLAVARAYREKRSRPVQRKSAATGLHNGGPGGTPRDVPTLVTWPGAGEMHRCPAATEQMAEAVSCAGTSPRSRFPNKTGFDGARPDFWLLEGP